MAQAILVESQISDGERFVNELDKSGINVGAALWLYDAEEDSWELRIALNAFDPKVDPREYYGQMRAVYWKLIPSLSFDLTDVRVVGTNDPVVQALRNSILAQAATVSRARLGANRLGQVYIPDAHLYRISESQVVGAPAGK